MKKKLFIFLLSCFFLISIINVPVYSINVFKEGVYKVSDLNFSPDNQYIVQNISDTESTYLQIFDKDQIIIQSIRLEPKSEKFNLIKLTPDYRIVLVGNGNIYISAANEQ
ncbi:hypothetical protein FHH43_11105 [Clostridium perfringens]|nr:hypothetical protein [Clostridium perfringens]